MSRFHYLSASLWDRSFRETSLEAKVVAAYVWHCKVRVSEGLFELPLTHIAADTGLEEDQVLEAFAELDEANRISYDPHTEVVFDRDALRFDPRKAGDNRLKGAVALFADVPECPLKLEFVAWASVHSPDLARALEDEYGDLSLPTSRSSPDQKVGSTDQTFPTEGASKGLARGSEGTKRQDLTVTGKEKNRSGDVNGEPPQCSYCSTSALVRGGKVNTHDGKPYCGWCLKSGVGT